MFLNQEGATVFIKNLYRNQSIFLVACGPSLLQIDTNILLQRGIVTFGINNIAAKNIRPNFWTCIDNTKCFHESIWLDPGITKFVPEKESGGTFILGGKPAGYPVKNCPGVISYLSDYGFDHKRLLDFPHVQVGLPAKQKCSSGYNGCRSVFFAALKLIYALGFRTVYLLGVDFIMKHDSTYKGIGKTYAFEQYKHEGGVLNNNNAYKIIDSRLHACKPHFEQRGFKVFNCNQESRLTAFPYISLQDAIQRTLQLFPKTISTLGYYGGKDNKNKFGVD